MDLSRPCRVFSGLRLQAVMCVSRGKWQEALGPSPHLFPGCSGPVKRLPASSHVVADPFLVALQPQAEPALDAGALGEPAAPPAPWPGQGVGGCQTHRSEPPSRPRSLYLHQSPLGFLVGIHHSPEVRVQVTLHGRCVLPVGLHPRPSKAFLGPHLGPLPPACRPWSRCSHPREASLCLSGGYPTFPGSLCGSLCRTFPWRRV